MKNRHSSQISTSIFLILVLFQNAFAEENATLPDITGHWVSLSAEGEPANAKITITQQGKDLTGNFTDSEDGEIIVDAPLIGYIDAKGNVIFDIQFGKVISTNRLKLSEDEKSLDGTFTNTMGNEGVVQFRRQ